MRKPKISIVIFSRPTESPAVAINSVKTLSFSQDLFEVIVIKGNNLVKQRNIALQQAAGEIVYFIDNDAKLQENALQIIDKEFSQSKVAAVGGPSLSPENEKYYLSNIIGYILATHFGALRMRLRYAQKKATTNATEEYLIGANLALRKNAVISVGGFDEKIIPNEETELLRRLKKKGYRLSYLPSLFIYRSHRKNLRELYKQFVFYGRGRMKQLLKSQSSMDIIFIVPLMFLFYCISLLFFHSFFYVIPLLIYILLALATSAKASIVHKRFDLLFVMPCIFPIIHIAYAIGLIEEFIFRIGSKSKYIKSFVSGFMHQPFTQQ